jgi:hypothetical protein
MMMTITAIDGKPCPLRHDELGKNLDKLEQTVLQGESDLFWSQVASMREYQKRYFRTRNPMDLKMALAWEKYVDEALLGHKPPEAPSMTQSELF